MKRTATTLLACLCLLSGTQAQRVWDAEHMEEVRQQASQPVYNQALQKLTREAERLLKREPVTVMRKNKVAASGDKHDYLSQARYFWPDSTKANGLPYVNRDGVTNPEIQQLDRPRLAQMVSQVNTLALAFHFTGDEKYAQKATEALRAWFLNADTRMNPNLNYAQIVPGQNGNRGRQYGVLDAYSFVNLLDGVALLERSKSFTTQDSDGLRAWFTTFLDWMLHSEQGTGERQATNNHGTAYDAQVIAYALYTGNRAVAEQFLSEFAAKRIDRQIESDGSQPEELGRTLAFGYSQYNISHLIDVFLMAQHSGLEVGGDSRKAFQKVMKAIGFLTPYLGKPVAEWPYQQIAAWEYKQQELCRDIYRAALVCQKLQDDAGADSLRTIYRKEAEKRWSDAFTLLYYKADLTDNAFASAESQLRYALKCVERTHATVDRPDRLFPRSTEADGSLRLVDPWDWCSGFFAGEMWQVYDYTRKPSWRTEATRFTLPLREMKDNRGTHDLGFMIYDSYGHAWRLTGDTAYAHVVTDAARSLASRYNAKVGLTRSWDFNSEVWHYPVIIDNMMNLELLFEASRLTGDESLRNIAIRHAETTMKNHFRKDFSSYHVVSYNPKNGKVEKKCTSQGFSDESVWSRGQAWGLYGFTLCYRYTHRQDFLEQAKRIAGFIFSQANMPEDLVPYWDMRIPVASPEEQQAIPRDASAAAIAASGLYELALYASPEEARQYRTWADKIVTNLYEHYRAPQDSTHGFLLLHSVGNHPAHDEIDVPLCYADYYYLEALWRKAFLGK